MSAETIDARGLSCPQPVLLAKKAIDRGNFPILVTVDSETSRENVTRLATHAGLSVDVEKQGELFLLRIEKK